VEYGSYSGGLVNAITRSGTNDFRGSVYYQMRNQGLVGRQAGDTRFFPGTFEYNHIGGWVGGGDLHTLLERLHILHRGHEIRMGVGFDHPDDFRIMLLGKIYVRCDVTGGIHEDDLIVGHYCIGKLGKSLVLELLDQRIFPLRGRELVGELCLYCQGQGKKKNS
jgi:hypothetical protein